ncbi:MAG: hypothetical protein KF900_10180 [Bacteroidetes bacterium]|nr:hypothetical protein [Bacteroidota bacterium]
MEYIIKTSNELSEQEIKYCLKLLLLQKQITPTKEKITSCPFVCLVYDENIPIALGAIKQVSKTYFDKAEITTLKSKYDFEIGYFYVLEKTKYRGKKIAQNICQKLLECIKNKNVFATTEESKENPMKHILEKFDFKKTGKTYIGEKTKKNIGLYLLTRK